VYFSYLLLGAQAPGTEVEPLFLTVHNHSDPVYVRQPAPVGMTHGVTDIMAELRCFVT
jgi:hypothetical protein